MKKLSVIHPFLFAIFPILFLFAHNIYEVPATDLLLPILVVIVGTLIVFFSSRLITKSYNKSGIITSYFLILFFSYGYVRDVISVLGLGTLDVGEFNISCQFILGPLWALLFIAGAFLVIKAYRNFSTFTKFLNVAAITLVTISLINIGISEIKTANRVPEEINKESASLNLGNPDNLPDIYYIILDQYTRQDTLKEFGDYDNSEFINYLTGKGFYVATKSRSNYSNTLLSLPSSLNMDYLTAKELASTATLTEMVKNSKVSRFLKEKGYRCIFIGSGHVPKGVAEYTDAHWVYKLKKSDFADYFLHSTALAPFTTLYFQSFLDDTNRKSRLCFFDKLADTPNIEEPTFVYAHILSPHPPFLFDRNGNPPKETISQRIRKNSLSLNTERYVDQLIFINKKVETVVDEIVSKSDVAPIIILQGDHGISWEEERIAVDILNAYYLPEEDNRILYETISPVNSFRIVFNLYFDMDYELLKDESYYGLPPQNLVQMK